MGKILIYYCTALAGVKTLLGLEGTEKGTETIPLLCKHLFSLQLQFGIRLKVSVFNFIS